MNAPKRGEVAKTSSHSRQERCVQRAGAMEEEDDFYGEQTSGEVESAELDREVGKLQRLHVATGFRDNAESARNAALQGGFDKGFADGAQAVAHAAFWYVFICSLTVRFGYHDSPHGFSLDSTRPRLTFAFSLSHRCHTHSCHRMGVAATLDMHNVKHSANVAGPESLRRLRMDMRGKLRALDVGDAIQDIESIRDACKSQREVDDSYVAATSSKPTQ